MLKKTRNFFSFLFSEQDSQKNLPPIGRSSIILVIVFSLLMMVGMLLMPKPGEKADVTEGVRLKENIYARQDYIKEDKIRSSEEKRKLQETLPLIYQIEFKKNLDVLNRLEAAFYRYIDADGSKKKNLSSNDQIWIQLQSQDRFWQSEFRAILTALHKSGQLKRHFAYWRNCIRHGILQDDTQYDSTVKKGDSASPVRQIIVRSDEEDFERDPEDHTAFDRKNELVNRMVYDISPENAKIRTFLKTLFMGLIEPNLTYDDVANREQLDAAAEERRVYYVVHEGQILFKQDQLITAADVALFQDYQRSLNKSEYTLNNTLRLVQQCVLLLTLFWLLAFYIRRNHPEVLSRTGAIGLFTGVIVLSLFVNRIFASIFLSMAQAWNLPHSLFYLALPLAMPALLIATLFGLRTAIYVGIFTNIATAAALGNSYPAFVTGLLLCGFGALAVHKVFDYKNFFIRSMVVTIIISLFSNCLFLSDYLFRDFSGTNHWHAIVVGLIAMPLFSGFSTALCTLLVLFFLESTFHVASNMSYLTFTDRNHALLKELSANAPGTYQHCDRVAMLGEKAATEVGLDPIKVQACALFHDVGKLKYPTMFTENNASGENRFMNMPPQESVRYIKEHITYGQELAKEYKLPYLLRRAIESHHGTDFISFFYEQAKKQGLPNLKEEDFRYDGPLPREKEIALVELADCCEAAVQSIAEPTPEKISDMVESLFEKKIRTGQLDETSFSLSDINKIKKSFVETLMAAHNKRIAYPGNKKIEGNT